MALLPYALRPKVVVRRKAIWSGLLGPSTFWKVVAVFVFGQSTIKKVFGRSPDRLGSYSIGANSFLTVTNATPRSAKQNRRAGITKQRIVDAAVADVARARPGVRVRVES